MIVNGKAFNPGEMRHKIKLGSRSASEDAGGFDSRSLAVVDEVWAKWVNAHGAEVWEAASQGAIKPATVTIRYRIDIDETWAVQKDNQWYEIVSMDDIQKRHELIEMKIKLLVSG